MRRRDFLKTPALAAIAPLARAGATRKAEDTVLLGPDKLKVSRVAMGTGTKGYNKSSNQTRQLGYQGLSDLLRFGHDRGLTIWDSADGYGSHPYLKEALKGVSRDKISILTKTRARTAAEMKADLDRFRQEIGTDYLDIVLLHALTEPNWPEERKGAMEVLAEAREKGIVRTHGCSCHSLGALKTAAKTPWVHVDLARINPSGLMMDAKPDEVIPVLREMKAAEKGVIGMKIFGEGQFDAQRREESLRFVLGLDCVDCFTIGFESRDQVSDLMRRVAAA